MFAGAAREVVFSNREVVRRVNNEFIPVALKAGMMNNPPRGIEGELFAEIGRSKPAPQGICTVNSGGKVLTWALSFDDDSSILKFLDHVVVRFKESSGANSAKANSITAERYMRFPGRQLSDVADNGKQIRFPKQHAGNDRCLGKPALAAGTLVGRIIGRPLDENGKPIAQTLRQEDYMEARLEIPVNYQQKLTEAASQAKGKEFRIPSDFARSVLSHAFLGQLDVNPLGEVPGSRNVKRHWEFLGTEIESTKAGIVRLRIEGESSVEGEQGKGGNPTGDGRLWEHRVTLKWQGYADIKENRVVALTLLANGDERLRWGNDRFNFLGASDVTHLMAGHKIDLKSDVRYGLTAKPASANEVVENPPAHRPGNSFHTRLRGKMERLQAGIKRMQQAGKTPSKIGMLMRDFQPLMQKRKHAEAEALLDKALELVEGAEEGDK